MIELAVICGVALLVVGTVAVWTIHAAIDGHQRAERAWEQERKDLLLRIQAPQVAVTRAINEDVEPGPAAVDMSDGPLADDSYWESREEMADRLAREEVA